MRQMRLFSISEQKNISFFDFGSKIDFPSKNSIFSIFFSKILDFFSSTFSDFSRFLLLLLRFLAQNRFFPVFLGLGSPKMTRNGQTWEKGWKRSQMRSKTVQMSSRPSSNCSKTLKIYSGCFQAHPLIAGQAPAAVPPGAYRSHTDRFLQSVDLKEIRVKQVFDPYVKWPFWHQERAISRAIRVRLPWFLHGSIAPSV